MNSIIPAQKFNPNDLNYSEVKKTPSGGKSVHINRDNTQGIIIQTPFMKAPFGIKTFDEESNKFTLELSLNKMDTDKNIKKFHDSLEIFDSKIVKDGVKNSIPWFNKSKITEDVLKALYNPTLRLSKDRETGEPDGRYPPTLRIKIPFYDDKWQCKVFDENKTKIDTDLRDILTPGCEVKALIKCGGLWFISGKYGCTWKGIQLVVKKPQGFGEYAFIESDEELENDNKQDKTNIIESDDETNSDDEIHSDN
jgi:hypothetical protein